MRSVGSTAPLTSTVGGSRGPEVGTRPHSGCAPRSQRRPAASASGPGPSQAREPGQAAACSADPRPRACQKRRRPPACSLSRGGAGGTRTCQVHGQPGYGTCTCMWRRGGRRGMHRLREAWVRHAAHGGAGPSCLVIGRRSSRRPRRAVRRQPGRASCCRVDVHRILTTHTKVRGPDEPYGIFRCMAHLGLRQCHAAPARAARASSAVLAATSVSSPSQARRGPMV
eukprot:926966-Pleurochrysis_carterae.AAC.4